MNFAVVFNIRELPDEDHIAIRRIQNGDPSSFEPLIEKNKLFVFGVIRSIIHDESVIEDLAQESFLAAFKGIRNFRGESQFTSWLYRITYNICLNHLRHKKTERVQDDIDFHTISDKIPNPHLRHEQSELKVRMADAIKTLRPRYRSLLHLHYYEGMRYEEISDLTGLPLGTVKSHIHRAREKIKNALEKEGWIKDGES